MVGIFFPPFNFIYLLNFLYGALIMVENIIIVFKRKKHGSKGEGNHSSLYVGYFHLPGFLCDIPAKHSNWLHSLSN